MMLFPIVPDGLSSFIDLFFCGTPSAVLVLLLLSRLLKLCAWHKIACLIPSSTKIEGYIDSYLFTFTQNELIVIHMVIGMLTTVFLILAFKRFFLNGRKGDHKAGA